LLKELAFAGSFFAYIGMVTVKEIYIVINNFLWYDFYGLLRTWENNIMHLLAKRFEGEKDILFIEDRGPKILQFKNLKKYENVLTHCFTTRLGGVSKDECFSLNLGFNRNDKPENVFKNYKLVADCMNIDIESFVFSNQVHDNKIKYIDYSDRGKGLTRESDIKGYDALITDQKGITLVTFYADCVPVFFYDPEKEIIALSHSGWRGTVKEIAAEVINEMVTKFNCKVEEIIVSIGPSIGKCCFEVGEEVYEEFIKTLPWSIQHCCTGAENGKWNIDLKAVIKNTLINCGVVSKNISVTGICTKCNKDVFFSHRGDNGRTGSMIALMQMK